MVWAHNSHLGDARATDMAWRRGELNLGQLARQAYGDGEVYNIGFTTYTGEGVCMFGWVMGVGGGPGGGDAVCAATWASTPAGRLPGQPSCMLGLPQTLTML